MRTLLLIDGNSILNRAFYGIRPLTNSEGLYTHAVYGMMNIILKHIEQRKPSYAAIAFDLKAPTFRHKSFDGYKANRKGMPEELAVQLPYAKSCMEGLGLKRLELEGYEADDIIGTCSSLGDAEGLKVYILTGDRDSFQLISDNVSVLLASTGETVTFDREKFYQKYGVMPEQFVDVKALMGDSSDNIPGVAGIGEKTALKLISEYNDLDSLYKADPSGFSPSVAKKLSDGKNSAYMSRFLARIDCSAPIGISLSDMEYKGIQEDTLLPLLTKLELSSMIKRLFGSNTAIAIDGASKSGEKATASNESNIKGAKGDNIDDGGAGDISDIRGIKDLEGASNSDLTAQGKSSAGSLDQASFFDMAGNETSKENGYATAYSSSDFFVEASEISIKELLCMNIPCCAVSYEGNLLSVYYNGALYKTNCDKESAREFLSKKERRIITHDLKGLCSDLGDISCTVFDVTLAAYVINSSEGHYDLDRLALKYLGVAPSEGYCPEKITFELEEKLISALKSSGQEELYQKIELPLASVLAEMETRGFKIDREGLSEYSKLLEEKCQKYKAEIWELSGKEFNINSTKQLGEILFGELGLPALKKTKTGYSTDAETLEKLRPYHPIIDKIFEYRQVTKLKSTYTDGLLSVADEGGRIHSSFNQTVTATGRLSSSEPNLQNIPVRTELGRALRAFFIPKNSDYLLVDADYSQIELRILAAVSGDKRMISAFKSGDDIHTITASQVFGVPLSEVTKEQRKRAKAVNFGIIYGIGGYSLSQDIGVAKYEADKYIENYYNKYPQIREYLDYAVEDASRLGYVTTIFGRRRYIPEMKSPKKSMQAFGKRIAMNSPIQGAAADIIKIAMINVNRALKESGIDAHLILQVHDELILESHHTCAKEAAEILKREMENAVSLAVPMIAEVGIGISWMDC